VNGRRYIDGGVRSSTNADLAAGCTRVLIITPARAGDPTPWGDLGGEVILLEKADVRVIYADDASMAAFGTNPLSPATRRPSAMAGRAIGRAHAADIARFWR
jgi:NTE family protein